MTTVSFFPGQISTYFYEQLLCLSPQYILVGYSQNCLRTSYDYAFDTDALP
jgi:hypothetical protein